MARHHFKVLRLKRIFASRGLVCTISIFRNWAKMVPEDSRQWFSSPIEKRSKIPVLVSKGRHPIPIHRRLTLWDYWNPDMNSFHFPFFFRFFLFPILMHQGAKGWDQGGLWPLRHRWHWDNRGGSGDDLGISWSMEADWKPEIFFRCSIQKWDAFELWSRSGWIIQKIVWMWDVAVFAPLVGRVV